MSGEVVAFPEKSNSPRKGGELLQNAEEKIASEQAVVKFQVERVKVIGKIFPFLLSRDDFSKMVKENAYDRDPESFQNHEDEPLLKRVENTVVANDNRPLLADAA